MSAPERKCPSCGFGLGNSRTETGKCPGCGYQVDPHPDHQPPAPGRTIREDDDPYVVSAEDEERWPNLKGVIAIRTLIYEYGRGIGAEPYGYHITQRTMVLELDTYVHTGEHRYDNYVTHAHEHREYECPKCGSGIVLDHFSQDRAGVAGGRRVECLSCHHELYEAHWA